MTAPPVPAPAPMPAPARMPALAPMPAAAPVPVPEVGPPRERARIPRRASLGAAVGLIMGLAVLVSGPAAASAPEPIPFTPDVFPVDDLVGEVQDLVFTEANLDGSLVGEDGRRFRLAADVLFAFDSADLGPRADAILGDLIDRLRAAHATRVRVDGYTDSVGESAYNIALSHRRADAVAARIRSALPGIAVTAAGHGEDDPIADNATSVGQALNRRVSVTVLG